jgi:hypothetical protein
MQQSSRYGGWRWGEITLLQEEAEWREQKRITALGLLLIVLVPLALWIVGQAISVLLGTTGTWPAFHRAWLGTFGEAWITPGADLYAPWGILSFLWFRLWQKDPSRQLNRVPSAMLGVQYGSPFPEYRE